MQFAWVAKKSILWDNRGMKNFTLKKISNRWLKNWPLILFLLFIGVVVGFSAFLSANRQSFDFEAEVLITNSSKSTIGANDYLFLLQSDLVADELSYGSCTSQPTQAGNVLTIVTSCTTSYEDAENYTTDLVHVFEKVVKNTYGADNVKMVVTKEPQKKEASVSKTEKLVSLLTPVLAVLVVSVVVAFIMV